MKIRQNTRRTALVIFRRGLSVSDAALQMEEAMSEWKEIRKERVGTLQQVPLTGTRRLLVL
jgi:hypothetical protein